MGKCAANNVAMQKLHLNEQINMKINIESWFLCTAVIKKRRLISGQWKIHCSVFSRSETFFIESFCMVFYEFVSLTQTSDFSFAAITAKIVYRTFNLTPEVLGSLKMIHFWASSSSAQTAQIITVKTRLCCWADLLCISPKRAKTTGAGVKCVHRWAVSLESDRTTAILLRHY